MNRECKACERPMRKQGHLAKDFPGTLAAGRNGLCYRCNDRGRAEWPLGPHMEPGDALDMGWLADPALKALIHERRTRGIPAQGYDPTEIKR